MPYQIEWWTEGLEEHGVIVEVEHEDDVEPKIEELRAAHGTLLRARSKEIPFNSNDRLLIAKAITYVLEHDTDHSGFASFEHRDLERIASDI